MALLHECSIACYMNRAFVSKMNNFGEQLKRFRKKKDLTQKGLSLAIGVNRNTVARWESGSKIPKSEYTKKIADYFGCTQDVLFDSPGSSQEISKRAMQYAKQIDHFTEEQQKVIGAFLTFAKYHIETIENEFLVIKDKLES